MLDYVPSEPSGRGRRVTGRRSYITIYYTYNTLIQIGFAAPSKTFRPTTLHLAAARRSPIALFLFNSSTSGLPRSVWMHRSSNAFSAYLAATGSLSSSSIVAIVCSRDRMVAYM